MPTLTDSPPQPQDLHAKLSHMLCDPLATRALKEYLSSLGQAELLIFYLEVTDFKEMFTSVLIHESRLAQTATGGRRGSITVTGGAGAASGAGAGACPPSRERAVVSPWGSKGEMASVRVDCSPEYT